MTPVWLITVTLAGNVVFQFVTPGEFDRASYLAGLALDAMADSSPADSPLDYTVTPVPYASAMTAAGVIIQAARDACD